MLEVIISIAIIGIISVGIYNGYIMIIKQTKAGQVKQLAALEGKKVAEEIQAAIEDDVFTFSENKLKIGALEIEKQSEDSAGVYTEFLDENFNSTLKTNSKYIKKITLKQTNKDNGGISFSNSSNFNIEDTNYIINISKEKQADNQPIKDYIYDAVINNHKQEDSKSEKKSLEGEDEIILFMYLEKSGDNRNVEIKDYKGKTLLNRTLSFSTGKLNIYINFNNYKQIDDSVLRNVKVNVYNDTKTDVPNMYIKKSDKVNGDIEIFKGQMNLYNNRAADPEEAKIGNLYDIKVEILKDNDVLFTGYSKKNIK